MGESSRKTLRLEEYLCQRCDKSFYIESGDRGSLDLDFGCPYGCDDNGEHIRSLRSEIREVARTAAENQKRPGRIVSYAIVLHLCPEEFELSMGRKPSSQAEFDRWSVLAEKGLLNGHIDWDILYECTCDAMASYGGDEG